MSFIYNEAKRAFARGEIDLVSDDIRLALLSTNTTADTEDDVNLMNGFSTLDEYDGSGYARAALDSQAVNEDAANNRAEFDAADEVLTTIGAGTRAIEGGQIYKHVTNDTDSVPIAFVDDFTNFNGNGGDITFQWNAEGILQFT
ncbi:MAG: hypothetical protein AB7G51_08470 [Steroidobacteraceae bacterium]